MGIANRLFWIVLLVGISPGHAENTGLISGAGTYTCGEFAKDYSQNPKMVENLFFTWAQGFMTGLNLESSTNGIEGIKVYRDLGQHIENQKEKVRAYCNDHPLVPYPSAVMDLYSSLPLKQK